MKSLLAFVIAIAALSFLTAAYPPSSHAQASAVVGGPGSRTVLPPPPPPPSGVLLTAPATQVDTRRVGTKVWTITCGYTGPLVMNLESAPPGTVLPGASTTCTYGQSKNVGIQWNTNALPGVHTVQVVYRQSAGGSMLAYTQVTVGN